MKQTMKTPQPFSARYHESAATLWELLRDPGALQRRAQALREREAALHARQERLAADERALAARYAAGRLYQLPPDRIFSDPARRTLRYEDAALIRLCDSIRRSGILQPLVVRADLDGNYHLLAGERRLRAARLLGISVIPAVVLEMQTSQTAIQALLDALRADRLSLFEQAGAIAALCDPFAMSSAAIAQALCVSEGTVLGILRLLRFTQGEREVITAAGLTGEHCRALLRILDTEKRRQALRQIVREHMTARQCAAYVDLFCADGTVPALHAKTRIVLKDLTLFCNAIERAVDTCRAGGVDVRSMREETPQEIRWVLRIPRAASQEQPALHPQPAASAPAS